MRRPRLAYLYANAFEFWIGLAAFLAAVTFAIVPDERASSAIGRTLHPWDVFWHAGYGIGGLLICLGLLRLRPRWEATGLSLLGASVLMNALATFLVRGLPVIANVLILLAVTIACYARINALLLISKAGER